MDDTGARAFAAFRELVHDDFHLASWLRVPLERDAFCARVVVAGAEKGFVFAAEDVRAALRTGENTWLTPGDETAA